MDFETLYRQWWPYAMSRTCARCSEAEREDVVQEAFIMLWRRHGDEVPEDKAPLLIHMAVRDVLREQYRRRCSDRAGGHWSERTPAPEVASLEARAEVAADRGNPTKELASSISTEQQYLAKEQLLEAIGTVMEMSPKWRNAVRSLFMVNGMQRFQRRYGCTANAYHNLVKRIRYKLEEALGIKWKQQQTYVTWSSLSDEVHWELAAAVFSGGSIRSVAHTHGMHNETLRTALKREVYQ